MFLIFKFDKSDDKIRIMLLINEKENIRNIICKHNLTTNESIICHRINNLV